MQYSSATGQIPTSMYNNASLSTVVIAPCNMNEPLLSSDSVYLITVQP